MKTLESRIADEIIEFGDGNEFQRKALVESWTENLVDAFLEDADLDDDEAFAKIYPVVLEVVQKKIDWKKVDEDLYERHKEAEEWFNEYHMEIDRITLPNF